MIHGTTTKLALLLSEWNNSATAAELRPQLALKLLRAGDEFLSDHHGSPSASEREGLHAFLEATSRPEFLQVLPDDETRHHWADAAIRMIDFSGYTLEDMLIARVGESPRKTYFEELRPGDSIRWSYSQVQRRLRSMAAVFLRDAGAAAPRVAPQLDNSVDGACCDLACLVHDILVTPLSWHGSSSALRSTRWSWTGRTGCDGCRRCANSAITTSPEGSLTVRLSCMCWTMASARARSLASRT